MYSSTAQRTALILALIGFAGMGFRYHVRHHGDWNPSDSVWRLSYVVECESGPTASPLTVAGPRDTRYARVVRQDVRTVNFVIAPRPPAPSDSRVLELAAEEKGESRLVLRCDIHLDSQPTRSPGDADWREAPNPSAAWLDGEEGTDISSAVVVGTLDVLRRGAARPNNLVQRVFSFCRALECIRERAAADDAEGTLAENRGSPLGVARAMVALCRAAGLPSRTVTGFELLEANSAAPLEWVEVWVSDRWTPFDPIRGFRGELPSNVIPVCRGNPNIVTARNVNELEAEFSIRELPLGSGEISFGRGRLTDIFDLTRLPLEMHNVLSLILLMPFGALVTCIARNLVGIKTSGTFTPTLLAMSFVSGDWRPGIVVLIVVVVLGFFTRNVLNSLQLLMLPRLSIVLTFIVCCIVLGISVSHYLHLSPAAEAVFLPLVILTMLVERFYVTTQEDGTSVAMKALSGTIVVGACCYLVMRWDVVARGVLAYPEVHFVTTAVLVLLGRYTGYQLLELWRFRGVEGAGP